MKTFDEAMINLIDIYNSNVSEFNQVVDELEELRVEVDNNKTTMGLQHEALEIAVSNAQTIDKDYKALVSSSNKTIDTCNRQVEKANRSLTEFKRTIKNRDHELTVLKKEKKALKEQVKRLQAANKAKEAKLSKQTESKGINQSELPWFTVWERDDEVLIPCPKKLTMGTPDGKKDFGSQVTLMYSDKSGTYLTAILDDNNEVMFSSPVLFSDDTPERTKKICEKFTMKPSDEAREFCREWLYRINVVQKGIVKKSDY